MKDTNTLYEHIIVKSFADLFYIVVSLFLIYVLFIWVRGRSGIWSNLAVQELLNQYMDITLEVLREGPCGFGNQNQALHIKHRHVS